MSATHAYATNWQLTMMLDDALLPARDRLRRALGRVGSDGDETFSMWRLPTENPARGVDPAYPDTFLQSTGSADAMTIEWRREEPGEESPFALYAIGRPSDVGGVVTISRGGHPVEIPSGEAFTADEAAEVYWAFHENGEPPAGVHLRLIERFDF